MTFLGWLLRLLLGEPEPRRPVSFNAPARPATRTPSPPGTTATTTRAGPPQRRSGPKPVDAGQFTPLTRDQALRQAKGLRNRWGAWFGRRDMIPPVSDPRTEIIDRAMVGQGFITPEELAEIHTIGDEMLRLRPDLGGAHVIAQEVVQQSKEERARLMQQKQAESAEKKRRRAEAVVHRRATDIVFLGRGVSRGLADRRSHVEKLQSLGLPLLSTPADVAAAIGITVPRLRWLAFHHPASRVSHYTCFHVPKKSGGQRTLSAPKAGIRQCQEWVLANILSKVPLHEAAQGFVPARSTLTNARPHVNRSVLVNTDLEDFFPSITFPRVKGAFQMLGYSPAVATILALVCTESPRRQVDYNGVRLHVASGPRALPQGACTSPALSNLVARRLDARLDGIARKLGWTYTRYADDATFSAPPEAAGTVGYLLARIRHITQDEGFRINETKTRILRRNARQSVTGINVNCGATLPRRTRRRLRAILHQAKRSGLAAQNRDGRDNFAAWLDGMIAYVAMVQPAEGDRLRQQFRSLAESH
jgi:retron-type reverse transcriptase